MLTHVTVALFVLAITHCWGTVQTQNLEENSWRNSRFIFAHGDVCKVCYDCDCFHHYSWGCIDCLLPDVQDRCHWHCNTTSSDNSSTQLPAGLTTELPAGSSKEVPAVVTVSLPVISSTELPTGISPEHNDKNGNWSSWNQWTPCSVTCGEGQKSRTRTCAGTADSCDGSYVERGACNNTCEQMELLKCEEFCAIKAVAVEELKVHPNAGYCIQKKANAHSEALVMSCCNIPSPADWTPSYNVIQYCDRIPRYTPVATFTGGQYNTSSNDAGIFVDCLPNGFKMISQNCSQPAYVIHVTRDMGNPDNYFLIHS